MTDPSFKSLLYCKSLDTALVAAEGETEGDDFAYKKNERNLVLILI